MSAGVPEMVILRWLARREAETASAIGGTYRMKPDEVGAHLATLERAGFVSSRADGDTIPPRRLYAVTAKGQSAYRKGQRP